MERLTGLDAAFLALETPTTHMHVMAAMVIDPTDVPGGFTVETLRRPHLRAPRRGSSRSGAASSRCRSASTTRCGSRTRTSTSTSTSARSAAPAPGGLEELAELIGEIAGRPLDRSRPLWQMWVVEGLEHGNVALIAKVHHAAIDGALGRGAHGAALRPRAAPRAGGGAGHQLRRPTTSRPTSSLLLGSVTSMARQPLLLFRAVVGRSSGPRSGSCSGCATKTSRPASRSPHPTARSTVCSPRTARSRSRRCRSPTSRR